MHSNVQFLYLLLFFAVGVTVLIAQGPYNECSGTNLKLEDYKV